MSNNQKISLLLRGGVAFAFIYPAISALLNPLAWIGYFPSFLLDIAPNEMLLLHTFGATEVILGVWILSGKKILIPSIIASLYLAAIIALNFQAMDIVFRDISILAMSIALALGVLGEKEA